MKVSYNWLKDYVDISMSPEELAGRLTSCGLKVESVEKRPDLDDTVLTIEVTSNRPDCLGMVGIAREVSAITGRRLKLPFEAQTKDWTLRDRSVSSSQKDTGNKRPDAPVRVEIKAAKHCRLYIVRVLKGVKVGPSPEWMVNRLRAVEIRPINNVVDVTNFVLMELGQPLHAFDYDKIGGKQIVVRFAKDGEKIVTLDRIERKLDSKTLIIADERNPVALAGIMGGADTEVSTDTNQVLLESACFEPTGIRRTSRWLGLMSESSYRFERSVDPAGVDIASQRAAILIKKIAGGEEAGGGGTAGESKPSCPEICMESDYPSRILGLKIQRKQALDILAGLGLEPLESGPEKIKVTVPSWRQDLGRPIDLVEEISRIYGYDKCPSTLPRINLKVYPPEPRAMLTDKVLGAMVGAGFYEVITYNLLSQQMLDKFNSYIDEPAIRLKNPLSSQQEFMRTSLLPGLAGTIGYNLNRQADQVRIFELGRVYFDASSHPVEKARLGIGLKGTRQIGWLSDKKEMDFFDLKAIIELLLEELKITGVEFQPKDFPFFLKDESAELIVSDLPGTNTPNRRVGILGQLNSNLASEISLPEGVYLGEIFLEELLQQAAAADEKKYQPIPKFPWATRDMAIIVPLGLEAQKLEEVIRKAGDGLVDKVILFDVYEGQQIPAGCRSLAFSIRYLDKEKTLTDERVEAIHHKICNSLKNEFKARLR